MLRVTKSMVEVRLIENRNQPVIILKSSLKYALALLLSCLLMGEVNAQVGTAVASGQTVMVDTHGACRQVTNAGAGTRMVFTGTAPEWQSFINAPNGLIMSDCITEGGQCGVAGEGVIVGGFCWYLGASNASCTETCASRGGYNEATRTYAGMGGKQDNCWAVMDALGVGGTNLYSGSCHSSVTAMGCYGYAGSASVPREQIELRGLCSGSSATAGAKITNSGRFRACACGN